MTTPGDESRTELAWREIVEHYGERPVLPDDAPSGAQAEPLPAPHVEPLTEPRAEPHVEPVAESHPEPHPEPLADDLVDDDPVETRERAIASAERFQPPAPPPFPRPRTWQRGVAWSGIFVAPALALLIGLLSIHVTPLVGWVLVVWFVGGFLYLVREMPRAPRDPWDDGSRI